MLYGGCLHFMAKMACKFVKPSGLGLLLSQLLVGTAMAQATLPVGTQPERLSDWLLKQAPNPSAYTTALQWLVPEEKRAQDKLKQDLLNELLQIKHL